MKLCLGTVQFGLNYGIQGNGRPQEEKVFEMLSYAIDHGVHVLDTASAYGEAEMVLGDYIRANPDKVKNVNLVSKLPPAAFEGIEAGQWEAAAIGNAKESLQRLGIRKLKAYLFHNAAYIFSELAVHALNAVKAAGLAEYIGVSIYTPAEAMKALEYPQIHVIQIPYNLFDKRLDQCGFFHKAKEQGVLVFARSSLLQGLIMMNPNDLPARMAFARGYLERFLAVCKEYAILPLNTAVGYVGCKSLIDYVVFGVDNMTQLKEYIAIQKEGIPLDMINVIDKTFENVEERLVNPVLWK